MCFNASDFILQSIQSKVIQFDELAIKLYNYQVKNNPTFAKYLELINAPKVITSILEINFLPITFFKSHQVITGNFIPTKIFTSSSTTGTIPSKHYVSNIEIYEKSYLTAFGINYGSPTNYTFLYLLPNYLERKGSSLIEMAEGLHRKSKKNHNPYYLYDFEKLANDIDLFKKKNQKIFLLGVTYALLDFAEKHSSNMHGHIVMETGGMKGRKEELTRVQIHSELKKQFNLQHIHAEYGMTELLSQAYSKNEGLYNTPPWMKIYITDPNDPFTILPIGKTGIVNIIDLANIESCAFIQTQDLGKINPDNTFEIIGRVDFSEIRGCNLLYVG